MIMNMVGGGGASLNFKIVGGTVQPENPKENTILVDTDTTITGWSFSAAQPENPTEGMVWFATGTSSAVEFNALKRNGIHVYPISAKQYVSGAWVDKTAMIYQHGVWNPLVVWDGELYFYGNQYEDVTGGWGSDGYYYTAGSAISAPSFADDHMYSNVSAAVFSGTMNAIDLTNISTITFHVNVTTKGSASTGYFTCYVSPDKKVDSGNRYAKVSTDVAGEMDLIMDVSGISGLRYVVIYWPSGVKAEVYSCVMK